MFGSFGGGFNQPQQSQQPQQQGLFGAPSTGFGATPGFGAQPQQQTTAFGAQPQPQANSFGFGVNTSFGAAPRPAFGGAQSATTAAPSMFGAQPQQNSFGFGAQPQQPAAGGLFGAAQPAAGGFGTPATTSFGFGAASTATTPSFGAPGQTTPTNNFGTGNPQFVVTQERETSGGNSLSSGTVSNFMSISAMPNYKNWNFEELRVQDYSMGKKFSTSGPGMAGASAGAFGTQPATGFGGGAFGAAAAPTGGLFGQSQPTQQSTGFGFGAAAQPATGGGLFGAANTTTPSLFGGTSSTPAFGAAAATPAFGQAAAPTTGFSFGAAANNAPKTGFGAFGAATTTPSAFGQATNTGFGAAPTGNAFGQQSGGAFGSTATGGGLFGAKPATTSPFGAATTGGGFGSALGANNTGGAFGAAPAAATTGAFGVRPTTTSPFGAAAPAGGSLFGAASAPQTNPFGMGTATPATGGLFGAAPAATTGFGTGLGGGFGATKPAATGGLFGNTQPANSGFGSFGAATTAPAATGGGLFGGGTGGFGATTPAPATGGFGSSLGGGFGASLGGFGATTTPATGGLFGGANSFGQTNTSTPQPTLHAGIDKNPYGNNPLFNGSTKPASGSVATPALFAPPETAEKKQALLPHYKMTPKSASKIKLRGFTPAKPPSDFFSGVSGGSAVVGGNGSSPAGLPKSVLGMLKDDGGDALSGTNYPGAFKPRVKKLVITDEPEAASNGVTSSGNTPARNGAASLSGNRTVRFLDESEASNIPVIDVTLSTKKAANAALGSKFSSPAATPAQPASNRSSSPKRSPAHAAAPIYETEPSTEELMMLSDVELTRVEGYTVILPTVGKVRFLEPVNLIQASPSKTRAGIVNIPGTIVILKHKVIEVYPDDTEKDPEGMGVNVPAEVSLERCWVVDKSTGRIIDDDTDPRFDRHFKRLESIEGTKMIGFNKSTGTWRFRVDHFSKYGLEDDDDDAVVASVPSQQSSEVFVIEDDEEEEEETEEDDESMSFGNDSFAFVKSRKVNGAGGKVGDLRKVAFMNRMQQQKQQLQSQGEKRDFLEEAFESDEDGGDDGGESDENGYEVEEDEDAQAGNELDLDEEDFLSGEEDIVDEYDGEEVITASNAQGPYSEEEAAGVNSVEQNDSEMELSPEFVRSSVAPASARRISQIRAGLFLNNSNNHSRSTFGGPSFGASTTSAVTNLYSSAPNHKRGLDSMMDVDSGSTSAFATTGKLPSLNVEQEFQSPVKVKRTADTPAKVIPPPRVIDSSKTTDEHIVPVKAALVSMKDVTIASLKGDKDSLIPIPPLADSVAYKRESYCLDAGLSMGRSFRVGWAPGGKYVVSGRSSAIKICSLPTFVWESEADSRLRDSLCEAERYRHVKSLESILEGTTLTVTRSSAVAGHRTIVEDSYQPAKSLLQTSAVVAPECPIALIDGQFNFSSLTAAATQANQDIPKTLWTPTASASVNDPRRPFTHIELSVWNIASALFDPISLPSEDVGRLSENGKASDKAISAIKEGLQKDRVSAWLKSTTATTQTSATAVGADHIYSQLVTRRVAAAVQTAIKNRDFRLATVLSQISGVGANTGVSDAANSSSGHGLVCRGSIMASVRDDISKQVDIWTKEQSTIPPAYMKIWKLLSGNVGSWDASVVEGAADWKQTFGLFLWYAEGGALSLADAVKEYDMAWGINSKLGGKSPVPWYVERKRGSSSSSSSGSVVSSVNWVKDVSYNLLKLKTDDGYSLESTLVPSAVGPNLLDHRVSWLLWVVLCRAKKFREFAKYGEITDIYGSTAAASSSSSSSSSSMDYEDTAGQPEVAARIIVSKTADVCTASLCSTLESLGLWKWAIFVGMFLSTQNGREQMVKEVLARWFPVNDVSSSVITKWNGAFASRSEVWSFIVGRLKVPAVWVHEAKALRARYNGDIVQECVSLIDAQKFNAAHQLIVAVICPMALLNESFLQIKNLLSELPTSRSQIENWSMGGGFVLDAITVLNVTRQSIATNDIAAMRNVIPECNKVLNSLVSAKAKREWITRSLSSRMSVEAVNLIKKEWSVCYSHVAGNLVGALRQIEEMLQVGKQIDGGLLKDLPLSEDVRAKYVGSVVQRSWFGFK
ncbi:nuclear protein 96-domain-containing protein [Obelidium mucronatum]|nr:nuclear protein 96-domain-containing protein [Obelidium mucronatum]